MALSLTTCTVCPFTVVRIVLVVWACSLERPTDWDHQARHYHHTVSRKWSAIYLNWDWKYGSTIDCMIDAACVSKEPCIEYCWSRPWDVSVVLYIVGSRIPTYIFYPYSNSTFRFPCRWVYIYRPEEGTPCWMLCVQKTKCVESMQVGRRWEVHVMYWLYI